MRSIRIFRSIPFKQTKEYKMRSLKKVILSAVLIAAIASVAGCGSKTEPAAPAAPAEPAAAEKEAGIANPWVEITEEEADKICPRMFKAPEGATELVWMKCESLGDPDKGTGPLIQLKFKLDGNEFTARAQYGVAEDDDISGIYATWDAGPDDCTLANWGEGHMSGKSYGLVDDEGYTHLITWYDIEIGIKYSLSVTAVDLDGFDIQGVAEQMYSADNEPDVGE